MCEINLHTFSDKNHLRVFDKIFDKDLRKTIELPEMLNLDK